MARLTLLRHFLSQWNLENRFTGWVDVPLAKEGFEVPRLDFNVVYTSSLVRNLETVLLIFKKKKEYPIFHHLKGKMKKWGNFYQLNKNYIPVYVSEVLNERYYGRLQGLNKEETMKKYGKEKVHLWRRSFNLAPPGGESLSEVFKRIAPFYKKYIEGDLKQEKNVLIVASHNALRAIVKYIDKISDEDIIKLEIPFGGFLQYHFDKRKYRLLQN